MGPSRRSELNRDEENHHSFRESNHSPSVANPQTSTILTELSQFIIISAKHPLSIINFMLTKHKLFITISCCNFEHIATYLPPPTPLKHYGLVVYVDSKILVNLVGYTEQVSSFFYLDSTRHPWQEIKHQSINSFFSFFFYWNSINLQSSSSTHSLLRCFSY